ncbi:MAG: branched-chain amino acid ABC transporter permease [Burkholderiales bacterium]|nr:branched-chain amino acid ABC transporter permease [Burkholderiales bacterium]
MEVLRRHAVWIAYAAALLLAPQLLRGSQAVNLMSQMAIAIVACLSYNVLLGQGGMLSFGHAVYSGLAAFVAVHALAAIGQGWWLPVSLVPAVGGLAGAAAAVVLGYVTTRKAGTPFAMITLGIGELVFALALMLPEFFGGEGGVSANRTAGPARWGITYGPQIEVYYLLATYTFVATVAMYAYTRTPLGRLLEAVRENPERVEFIGYSTRRVRYLSFIVAGFFAGIAGGMYAVNFEIATAEVVGSLRSGSYLLFTFLGGAGTFFGPIIGGVLMVLAGALLSELTQAWLLYLGLIFIGMVMVAPGGVASLVTANLRLARHGLLRPLLPAYLALAATAATALAGLAAMIEMIYRLQLSTTEGATLRWAGVALDAHGVGSWIGAASLLVGGGALFELARRTFAVAWGRAQEAIAAGGER